MRYMVFCAWLLSLGMTAPWLVRVITRVSASFLFVTESCSVARLDHIVLLDPPGDGYLDCFHCLAVTNNAPVNICTPVRMWPCFQVFWVMYPGVELLGL